MTSLETLDLENNNLGGLEMVVSEDGGTVEVARGGMGEELHMLKRMQCLNLTKNKLRKIPDVVTQFVALRILDLTDNECVPSALLELGRGGASVYQCQGHHGGSTRFADPGAR